MARFRPTDRRAEAITTFPALFTYMIFNRPRMLLSLAGCFCLGAMATAQDEALPSGGSASGSSGAAGGSSGGTGASSAFGLPTGGSSGTTTAPAAPAAPAPEPSAPSPFAPAPATEPLLPMAPLPSVFSTSPTGTAPPAAGPPGAATTFGAPGAGLAPQQETSVSFTLPGAYGQSAQTFTLGEGRLARPRYRYTASLQFGYDDNIFSSSEIPGIPEVRQQVLVEPEIPEQRILVRNPPPPGPGGIILNPPPNTTPTFREVVIPGREAVYEDVVVTPEIPPQERTASLFSRASASFEMQLASRRQVFTFDLRGNADYYFDRPGDQLDINGSLSFNYLRRLTSRMQFSASASLAYLSQPDVRRVNTPSRNVGEYFNGTARMNLSYAWSKRFSTVTSLSVDSTLYMEEARTSDNYYATTFGTEARYLWSPRLTVLAELRYSKSIYEQGSARDSDTLYLLLGGEWALGKRISTSLRVGETIRAYETSSGSASSPYLESTISWRYHPTGMLSWNSRIGFEEPPSADATLLTYRTGLSLVQALSKRLRGSASINYIHRTTSYESFNLETSEDTFDFSVGLEYTVTRDLSLNASYNLLDTRSSVENSDYYRNRVFFGAEYAF